jgi:hypothetical protein
MVRRILLLASFATFIALTGCRHHCHKWFHRDECCPSSSAGGRNSILLPPTTVPTTPGPAVPSPAPFPPPAVTPSPSGFPPAPKSGGVEPLFPDPLPGNPSSRPAQPGANFLGAPVAPTTKEPPKASVPYTKVKDGLFAGNKPTLDGFTALKNAGFRTVIYLHAPGADVNAVKDMASTRDLQFIAIETTPETLVEASKQFDREAADRRSRPAYVFADNPVRAGAVWYLHFRSVDAQDNDVARLRAKPLGLSEQGEEGKAFALAIARVLETK